MKRRAFLKGLGALIAAPVAAKAVVEPDPEMAVISGFSGNQDHGEPGETIEFYDSTWPSKSPYPELEELLDAVMLVQWQGGETSEFADLHPADLKKLSSTPYAPPGYRVNIFHGDFGQMRLNPRYHNQGFVRFVSINDLGNIITRTREIPT